MDISSRIPQRKQGVGLLGAGLGWHQIILSRDPSRQNASDSWSLVEMVGEAMWRGT